MIVKVSEIWESMKMVINLGKNPRNGGKPPSEINNSLRVNMFVLFDIDGLLSWLINLILSALSIIKIGVIRMM